MSDFIHLPTLLTSIVTSLFVSFFSVNLALRKYKSEKWWDFKASCYLSIIEALNNMVIYCDLWLDEELEEKDVCEDTLRKYEEEFKNAGLLLKKQVGSGKLLLSDDIYKILYSLAQKVYQAEGMQCKTRGIGSIRTDADECLSKLTPFIKDDLKVRNSLIDK